MKRQFIIFAILLTSLHGYSQAVIKSSGGLNSVSANFNDSITANFYSGLGYSDTKKIQLALDLARSKNQKLIIANNFERGSNLWQIDSAILLNSNEYIIIRNAKLKLTDSSRDNIFRTANCGIGITNAASNPVSGITIEGVGDAVLEGADNPRASGDAGKALTLHPSYNFTNSYGTDSGKVGRNQNGDWRNYGIIIAYGTNINISGLKLSHLHAYGIDFDRCKNVVIRDIILDMPGYAANGDTTRLTYNNDGIDFTQSINNVVVDNISGVSHDDNIALNILNLSARPAGGLYYYVTGDTTNRGTDSIYSVSINNVQAKCFANNVRVFVPANFIAKNVTISNINNTIRPGDILFTKFGSGSTSANISIGSKNPTYGGGNNPFGTISGFNISNLKSTFAKFGLSVVTSLSESFVSGINKASTTYSSTNPVYVDTPTTGLRNVVITPLLSLYGDSVASASAIVPTGNTFHVTGTTTVTSITATGINSGTILTIIFDGILTFTDGGNLKLAGNFTTAANSTITLRYDGTNFYEMSRSTN